MLIDLKFIQAPRATIFGIILRKTKHEKMSWDIDKKNKFLFSSDGQESDVIFPNFLFPLFWRSHDEVEIEHFQQQIKAKVFVINHECSVEFPASLQFPNKFNLDFISTVSPWDFQDSRNRFSI